MTAVPSGWSPEQARKRLDAATPYDWTPWQSIYDEQSSAVSDFIAHAPADIAALLALLDDARETLEQLTDWDARWPSSRIYDYAHKAQVHRELDECVESACAFLARFAADKDSP